MASKAFPRWSGLKVSAQTPDVLDGVEILVKRKGKECSDGELTSVLSFRGRLMQTGLKDSVKNDFVLIRWCKDRQNKERCLGHKERKWHTQKEKGSEKV